MERDYIVYSILLIGMVGLWLYHRKTKNEGQPRRPRTNIIIILGILFVMGMLYILKQAGMLPAGFN